MRQHPQHPPPPPGKTGIKVRGDAGLAGLVACRERDPLLLLTPGGHAYETRAADVQAQVGAGGQGQVGRRVSVALIPRCPQLPGVAPTCLAAPVVHLLRCACVASTPSPPARASC